PDVVDPHPEPAPGDALRREGSRRSRRGQRGHARERAAHGIRWSEGVGHGLARGRSRGARRLLRVEVRQSDLRSREGVSVAVLGPGAIGGSLAVWLALAGEQVICVGREETTQAIREAGLTLVHDGRELTAQPAAADVLEQPVDLLLVTVKAPQLDA